MISSKELMIGDWVTAKCYPKPSIARVTLINGIEDEVYVEAKQLYMLVAATATLDKLEPIPLTPEILENNGFTHDRLAEQAINKLKCEVNPCYMDSEDHRISINNCRYDMNTNNDWYVHIDTEDMCTMAMVEITYVHEFQHALRLCGIEKEIKL